MKKAFPLIFSLAFFTAAFAPHFVAAQADRCTAPGFPAECGIGQTCGPNSFCIPVNNVGGNGVGGSGGGVGGGGAGGLNFSQLTGYAGSFRDFINVALVPLLIAIAFVVFLYGVFNYFILGASDEEKRKTGRTFVMYGIVGFVLIFSLWGIVYIGYDLLNLGGQRAPGYPTL